MIKYPNFKKAFISFFENQAHIYSSLNRFALTENIDEVVVYKWFTGEHIPNHLNLEKLLAVGAIKQSSFYTTNLCNALFTDIYSIQFDNNRQTKMDHKLIEFYLDNCDSIPKNIKNTWAQKISNTHAAICRRNGQNIFENMLFDYLENQKGYFIDYLKDIKTTLGIGTPQLSKIADMNTHTLITWLGYKSDTALSSTEIDSFANSPIINFSEKAKYHFKSFAKGNTEYFNLENYLDEKITILRDFKVSIDRRQEIAQQALREILPLSGAYVSKILPIPYNNSSIIKTIGPTADNLQNAALIAKAVTYNEETERKATALFMGVPNIYSKEVLLNRLAKGLIGSNEFFLYGRVCNFKSSLDVRKSLYEEGMSEKVLSRKIIKYETEQKTGSFDKKYIKDFCEKIMELDEKQVSKVHRILNEREAEHINASNVLTVNDVTPVQKYQKFIA